MTGVNLDLPPTCLRFASDMQPLEKWNITDQPRLRLDNGSIMEGHWADIGSMLPR